MTRSALLSEKEIQQIVDTNHCAPRSVLGFHQLTDSKGKKSWTIRVMEHDADSVLLNWHGEPEKNAQPLKKIHDKGLFEIQVPPRKVLAPYHLFVSYKNGDKTDLFDPYYFTPQLTDMDRHLFHEGNHFDIYRKLGAHLKTVEGISGTLFAVWAPNAKRVSVVGDFNYWNGKKYPMHSHVNSGIWELFIPGAGHGNLYKYEIKTKDDQIFIKSDPYGFQMEKRPGTASVVTDLDGFQWKDDTWIEQRKKSNPLEKPLNIYEVHLGSWKRVPEENNRFLTYREYADELIPYILEMGYTHIELLPVAEHPLDASWGYQVTGYFAPTARHGTAKEFMAFINRCHEAGIGVIIDWVPAHFPKDSNGLSYFDGTCLYEHEETKIGEHLEWGTLIFNFGRHEVKNFLIANALFWFDYYHIDGIRVDAVASMLYLDYNRNSGDWIPNKYGGNENIEAIEFLKKLNETLFHYYPGVLSIAEESTAWPGVSLPTHLGGLGFNLKWNMGWMNDTLRYISADPVFRKYDHHMITFSLLYAFSENFILPISHDEVVHGKRSLLNKMPGDRWQQFANARVYLMYQTAHPGKRLCFMGTEFAQVNEWNESQSLEWHLLKYEEHRTFHAFYKKLNRFYCEQPALYAKDFESSGFEWIDACDHENSVLSFIRHSKTLPEQHLTFIFNFTPVPRSDYLVGASDKTTYEKIFDTDANEFGGSGFNNQSIIKASEKQWQGRPYSINVDLPPLGAIVLRDKK